MTSPLPSRMALTDDTRRWWTLAAMCFALFMMMLDNTVTNVALPSIQRDLHTSLAGLEWTVNIYTLFLAVLLVTGGRLGDIFGRRRIFLMGVVVFGLSSAAIGLSPNIEWLITGRALQGVGAALMMPATLSIISATFPPHERGKAIGTWAGVSASALALGPLVGGFLAENVSWQAIFFLNVPVALAAVAVTLYATHESRDDTVARVVDFPGVASITVGLGTLTLGLVEGNAWGWDSPRIIGLFAAAAVGLIAFGVVERRVRVPMVDFSFFTSGTFIGANLVAFIVSFAMLAVFFFLALYMQNVLGYSPFEAGLKFLPSTAVIIVAGPIAGRLTDRIGARPLMTAGLALTATSLFLLSRVGVHTSYAYLVVPLIVMGFGMGLTMSPMSTAAMNAVERSKAGVASGVLSMSRMVGGTLGVAVVGALMTTIGSSEIERLVPAASAARHDQLTESIAGAGLGISGSEGDAVRQAFVSALGDALLLSGTVAAIGAILAFTLIRHRPGHPALRAAAAPAAPAAEPAVSQPAMADRVA